MALQSARDRIVPVKTWWGSSIPTITVPEASGLTHAVGEVLKMSGGYVTTATAGDNFAFGIAMTTGKALASAGTHDGTGVCAVVPAHPWVIFEGAIMNATTASAKIKNSQLFNDYALARSASLKIWYVDGADTDSGTVTIVGFKDATGTQNGHVYFIFNENGRSTALGLEAQA